MKNDKDMARGKCGVTGEVHTGFWWGDLVERSDLQDLGVVGRIISKRFYQDIGWVCRLDSSGSGYEQVAGSCEYDNKPSCFIKCRGFLEWQWTS
jgi:hypothetical protein